MGDGIVTRRTYYVVFGALMILTIVTVLAATVDLGRLNAVVALAIAVGKAVLVLLFFMHLRSSDRLTKVAVSGGLLWLVILLALTLSDYLTRGMAGI